MHQRQVTHPRGTFHACADCGREPRHFTAQGSTRREPVAFAERPMRHQLECGCGRCTGWRASLPDAEQAWGELGATLALPLPAPRQEASNVRTLRARGRR